jgi:hypothetical protein
MIPTKNKNIAFIGFSRPTMGSIASIAEMQSWWVELFFQNKFKYRIRTPIFRNIDTLNLSNEHINTVVIGCYYLKDLAKDMNLLPNMPYLMLTDKELFLKILTGSCHPMLYRIHGQKSYPNARKILMETFPNLVNFSFQLIIYQTMFVIYHIFFILSIFLLTYLLGIKKTIMKLLLY